MHKLNNVLLAASLSAAALAALWWYQQDRAKRASESAGAWKNGGWLSSNGSPTLGAA